MLDSTNRASLSATVMFTALTLGSYRVVLSQPPPNDTCASATAIGNGIFPGDTTTAGNDGSTSCGFFLGGPDVWFKYTAPSTATFNFNTLRWGFLGTVLSLHSGCPGTTANQVACSGHFLSAGATAGLALTAGQEVWVRVGADSILSGPFELEVGMAGAVAGRVTDANGIGVGATLRFSLDGHGSTSVGTAADGTYQLSGLPAREILAEVSNNFNPELVDEVFEDRVLGGLYAGTPSSVLPGATTTLHFVLEEGGRIAGDLVEAGSGSSVAFGGVSVYDVYGGLSKHSDASSGSYEVTGLPTGAYYLMGGQFSGDSHLPEVFDDRRCGISSFVHPPCRIDEGEPVAVTAGQVAAGIDFQLVSKLGARIEGNVGDGVAGLLGRVIAYDSDGRFVNAVSTQANGDWAIGGLSPGVHHLAARAATSDYVAEVWDWGSGLPCPNLDCDVTAGIPITLTDGELLTGLDFVLEAAGVIAGTITEEVSGDPARARVIVYDATGSAVTEAGSVGPYEAGLPPGNYTLVAGDQSAFVPELYDGSGGIPCINCDPNAGLAVTASAGATTTIDFELTVGAGIAGKIRREGTQLQPGLAAALVYDANGELVNRVYATPLGYTVEGLTPGSYFVVAASESDSIIGELYPDQPCGVDLRFPDRPLCDVLLGTPVTVSGANVTTGIDFGLDACPAGIPSFHVVDNLIVGAVAIQTCTAILVVEGFHISSTGTATLISPLVALEDGRFEGDLIVAHP